MPGITVPATSQDRVVFVHQGGSYQWVPYEKVIPPDPALGAVQATDGVSSFWDKRSGTQKSFETLLTKAYPDAVAVGFDVYASNMQSSGSGADEVAFLDLARFYGGTVWPGARHLLRYTARGNAADKIIIDPGTTLKNADGSTTSRVELTLGQWLLLEIYDEATARIVRGTANVT
jgi:hypothetical protein